LHPTLSKIEQLISSTGLDVGRLIGDVALTHVAAEGGPFVPMGDAARAGEDSRRHKMLESLVDTLPLRAPLDHYRVESPFGARRDPFNHRRGFHTGVDLSAPYRTHVFSTAPGIVIFAGAEGEWGRLVEIDNGHGIVTRYAHMHRVFVVKGQKVPVHYAIGELGSTGRSTGPHVHYEVVIDGTPVNPAKFLGVGDNVIRVGATQ
jgi:murein DD-endopeptidase MepM/ murein hydrolase activator NlpD